MTELAEVSAVLEITPGAGTPYRHANLKDLRRIPLRQDQSPRCEGLGRFRDHALWLDARTESLCPTPMTSRSWRRKKHGAHGRAGCKSACATACTRADADHSPGPPRGSAINGAGSSPADGILMVDDYAGYQAAIKLLPNAAIALF